MNVPIIDRRYVIRDGPLKRGIPPLPPVRTEVRPNPLRDTLRTRRIACASCPTPCDPLPNVLDLSLRCPLKEPRWVELKETGLGSRIEQLVKPIAKVLKLGCLDDKGNLKPESGCARRKAAMNRLFPHA